MPQFKLLRSKKVKASQHDPTDHSSVPDAPRSLYPTIAQVIYSDPEDEDGGNQSRRSSYYSFRDSGTIPRNGLISLIPSSLPDDDIKDQLNDNLQPGHVPRRSNVTFSDSEYYDDGSMSQGRKAEELAAKLDNVNTRQGAQRRTAMATYRTASYKEYEQCAVVVDSSYRMSTSSPSARSDSQAISEDEELGQQIDALNVTDVTASRDTEKVIYPFKRDELISPFEVNDNEHQTGPDDIYTTRQSTPSSNEGNVLRPLPQKARNVENSISIISKAIATAGSDPVLGPVAAPVVVSVEHHPGDSPPPSKSHKRAYLHYPAPIPARIRVPPPLKKKSIPLETSSLANSKTYAISSSFSFPMTAPMEIPEDPDVGRPNDEHSDSDESTVPVTPGYMTKFQSPHQALESMLNDWDKEPTSLIQPFTPQEELPVTDGPRSLIQELEERKTQQKSRQRNAAVVNSASLLQLDDVIRKGQEKRRTVVSIHGLVGTAQVKCGEDEVPLGAIYSKDPESQWGEPTRVGESRLYSHSPSNSRAQHQAMAHNRRTSSSSIPQRSIHDRQLSDSSAHFVPPSPRRQEPWQSNHTSGAPQGAILPEGSNSRNTIRERDMSIPNLSQLDGPASTNMPPAPSLYNFRAREMSVPNFDQYPQSYQKYPLHATNGTHYPPNQQQYLPQYQQSPYPARSPSQDIGTGYFRESIYASAELPMKDSGSGRHSSLLNSEEALYRRLRERESIMMGHPPKQPGPRPVSMMTREGHELLLLKQYYQQHEYSQQQYYNELPGLPAQGQVSIKPGIQQSNSRPNIPAALTGSPMADSSDSKKRELVERWRRSVYTGGA
ncbi:uncharacterized protein V1513DRAFT_436783 [Lipomyces chichibuensis]|uniref:uncharacterized protein n=1 Tax=Lipomyces chichibuensis TaxID=1546026 RepID=UPI00334358BC